MTTATRPRTHRPRGACTVCDRDVPLTHEENR